MQRVVQGTVALMTSTAALLPTALSLQSCVSYTLMHHMLMVTAVARLLLLIRSYGTIFWDFLLRTHLQYHLLLPLELKLACKKVHVIRKNILMVLSDMLYSHLHENQQNLLRLYLIQIGSMSCKMNMMLLFPTTPGTWCPQLHQKYY
jgi:hypothetical protein